VSVGPVAPTLWTTAKRRTKVFAFVLLADSAVDVCSEHNGQELRPCQVVKERDYLVDNLCRSIISRRGNEIKGKVDGR
jgi:hypothetical protein